MGTLMHPNSKLEKGENEKDVDETRYRGMIGSLMYLTSSRPDIVQSVGMCSRFQPKPKESHLSSVKRIIRYVHSTSSFGLWYPKIDDFSAVGYCGADFVGDRIDRRSTSVSNPLAFLLIKPSTNPSAPSPTTISAPLHSKPGFTQMRKKIILQNSPREKVLKLPRE
ncbi:secreted RxLR effector protein 161-like [Arachis duranensis]|uniref:Secreted RxLR effector protein 161-like n=1 Tax=Arachis duranensis TaxID=130453 RepID=A0A6P4DIS3_ARADU|nr:secreted RxLR effector protein 161-like [Arachis duranensis]